MGDGRRHPLDAPRLVLYPGLAVSLAALGLDLLGAGLRDALDPQADGARLT